MAKVKVTLSNYESHDRDGTEWCLSPVRLELDGKVLEEPGDPDRSHPFYGKVCELLGNEFKYSLYVQYYNDNPVVWGVPEPTVTVGGVTLEVEELVSSCSGDPEYPSYVTVEVEAPEGFFL